MQICCLLFVPTHTTSYSICATTVYRNVVLHKFSLIYYSFYYVITTSNNSTLISLYISHIMCMIQWIWNYNFMKSNLKLYYSLFSYINLYIYIYLHYIIISSLLLYILSIVCVCVCNVHVLCIFCVKCHMVCVFACTFCMCVCALCAMCFVCLVSSGYYESLSYMAIHLELNCGIILVGKCGYD